MIAGITTAPSFSRSLRLARAFIFTSQGSAEEIAHAVWRALPRIAEIADLNAPAAPYIYKVSQSGIQIVFPSPKFRFPLPR